MTAALVSPTPLLPQLVEVDCIHDPDGEVYFRLEYCNVYRYLLASWVGQNRSILNRWSYNMVLDAMKRYRVERLVLDTFHHRGSWSSQMLWVQENIIPKLQQLPNSRLALVLSNERTSRYSGNTLKLLGINSGLNLLAFDDLPNARSWLLQTGPAPHLAG